MYARLHFMHQHRVDGPLTVEPAHIPEAVGYDAHAKMGLPFGPCSGMAGMQRTVVDDLKFLRRKGLGKLFANDFGDRHNPPRPQRPRACQAIPFLVF